MCYNYFSACIILFLTKRIKPMIISPFSEKKVETTFFPSFGRFFLKKTSHFGHRQGIKAGMLQYHCCHSSSPYGEGPIIRHDTQNVSFFYFRIG